MHFLECPKSVPELFIQKEQWDVNDEFKNHLNEKQKYVFTHRLIQFFYFFLFLGPIKLIFSLIFGCFLVILYQILIIFRRFFKNPALFQKWAFSILKPIQRAFLFSVGFVKIEVEGSPHKDTRLFLSNYASFIDPFLYFCCFPFTLLSYEECPNIMNYVFRPIFTLLNINTNSEISRTLSDPYNLPSLVFPEQKPGNGTAIVKFVKEPFNTDYVIQPVVIKYYLALTPETFNSVFSDGKDLKVFFFELLCIPFIKCKIKYLEPIVSKVEGEVIDSERRASMCQLRIASELGVLAINDTYPFKQKND